MSATELDRALHANVVKRASEKEKQEAYERAMREQEFMLGVGATEMSKEELRKLVDSDKRMYYRSEELNDKLYIHYKGWKEIRGLEGWTGLKALYAENNAFSKIEGLQRCRQLRSLFLQDNCIHKIEGLDNCPDLWSLNLSNNFIERIEGISNLRNLNTLTIAKNKIGFGGVDDLLELVDSTISTLDIQGNRIEDQDVVPEVLMQMNDLRVLYLKDNPCTKKIVSYRKNLTVYCRNLKYLDDRPVFDDDRRAAEAYNRGGLEEERAERRRIKQEERDRHDRNMRAFQEMIERARAEKRERDAMMAEDKYDEETDPVDTYEKRMRRAYAQHKEEHPEDYRDEAQEHANSVIAQEKNQKAKQRELQATDVDSETSAKDTPAAESTHKVDVTTEPPADARKEDTRKLIYEDIWDEPVPEVTKPTAGSAVAPSVIVESKEEPRSSSSTSSTLDRTKDEACSESSEAGIKRSWHNNYQEKIAKVACQLEAGKLQAKAQAKPTAKPEVQTAQALAFQPPPRVQNELDEMD